MKSNRVLIVCSKTNLNLKKYKNCYKIGIERGALNLIKNFNFFDLFCCDQDSITKKEINFIINKVKKILIFPKIKDYTDGELAIKEALKIKAKKIYFIAQGNRFDMELSCFNFICYYNIIFINDNTYAFLLKKGINKVYKKFSYRFFSLFSIEKSIITISNLKYNVKKIKLLKLSPNAISNEFIKSIGYINVLSGQVVAIYSK